MLANPAYVELIQGDVYRHRTYSMGTVDDKNCLNFYDRMIRVVDPDGKEFARYDPSEYPDHVAERVEPWSYLKFPYLKKVGWNGFTDGPSSGVYCATPLSRLNVSDRLATSRAQAEFERFHETLGSKKVDGRYEPVHERLATHWARLIELLYAAEHMLELATDAEITSPGVRSIPTRIKGTGIGSVEAPRGTLTHHYQSDEKGVLTAVNLIVGTTNNHAAISMSIRKAAEQLIGTSGMADEALLNKIEMAFRLYDPCMSCATHSFPGTAPLLVNFRNESGEIVRTIRRD